jgi:4-aminobutyrate aminotransferase/(S)-3-amino-2-methylpropionate transaminase
VLDVIAEEKLLSRADAIGARIRAKLAEVARRNDIVTIANLRGLGAMLAFDIVSTNAGLPDGAMAKEVAVRALQYGLIVLTCGTYGETVRILVPLTVPDAVLDEGLEILERALLRPDAS